MVVQLYYEFPDNFLESSRFPLNYLTGFLDKINYYRLYSHFIDFINTDKIIFDSQFVNLIVIFEFTTDLLLTFSEE